MLLSLSGGSPKQNPTQVGVSVTTAGFALFAQKGEFHSPFMGSLDDKGVALKPWRFALVFVVLSVAGLVLLAKTATWPGFDDNGAARAPGGGLC